MLKFHVARMPLMLISNGFESSPELAGLWSVTGSPSPLCIDDASLLLLLLRMLAACLRNASIGQVNLNSMSEVTGASTSRLQEEVGGEAAAEWVLERRLLELPAASENSILPSCVTFIYTG